MTENPDENPNLDRTEVLPVEVAQRRSAPCRAEEAVGIAGLAALGSGTNQCPTVGCGAGNKTCDGVHDDTELSHGGPERRARMHNAPTSLCGIPDESGALKPG